MEQALLDLGFTKKEIQVYLALLEFGTQPASVIAKKTKIPKATVLFLFENLVTRGYVRKSQRGRTQYFYADPNDLEIAQKNEWKQKQQALKKAMPLLHEFKNPFTSQPRLTFFEGVDGCRKAYSLLLESTTEILEFGTHDDLTEKLGVEFMNNFIDQRVKNNIHLHAICNATPMHLAFEGKNQAQLREIQFFPDELGRIYSSIAIFENKVLLTNLYQDAFAILIENKQVAETLKTIYRIGWSRSF